MSKRKNEITIYLKQDIKDRLDYLANLMDIPTSRLLRFMIEEETFINQVNVSIQVVEKAKQLKKDKESQLSIYDIK